MRADEPLKKVSTSCTEALYPEFNAVNDFNDCLLLRSRVFWRGGGKGSLIIDQTMDIGSIWKQSTGSSVWGGGIVLARYMEGLGDGYWSGKRVIELGTGAGLGAITAAKLGAAQVLATDLDTRVLELTTLNAANNLGAQRELLEVAPLTWGEASTPVDSTAWDVAIGSDLTYNRDVWPDLFKQLQRLRCPAILSASERRANELTVLREELEEAGFRVSVLDSPLTAGYAGTSIKLFRIEAYDGPPTTTLSASPALAVATSSTSSTPKASAKAKAKALAAARAAEKANEEAIARIAAGAIRVKCNVDDSVAGKCAP